MVNDYSLNAPQKKVLQSCEILRVLKNFPLSPNILEEFEWENQYIVVLNFIDENRLDKVLNFSSKEAKIALLGSAGFALGLLHKAIPQSQLICMNFWKNRDDFEHESMLWSSHLQTMIKKWFSRINQTASDFSEFSSQLTVLEKICLNLREPFELSLLHCDYVGRNILVDKNSQIVGILDFDAARIGDPVYDLAKIVWLNIDYKEVALRDAILKGWELAYGESVPRKEFLCYVGVQCLAAIAWADKNISIDFDDNFRVFAKNTLKIVIKEIQELKY